MSDWQVGDLALCIATDATILTCGRTYEVILVTEPAIWETHGVDVGLVLKGHPHPMRDRNPEGDFWQGCFIKITPPEADEFDRETIDLMKQREQNA